MNDLHRAPAPAAGLPSPALGELERGLMQVEQELGALAGALSEGNAPATEAHAAQLHLALAGSVRSYGQAARAGAVPASLRNRLREASAQVAKQREALARATASLDRAIDVLLPSPTGKPSLYSPQGTSQRTANRAGVVSA